MTTLVYATSLDDDTEVIVRPGVTLKRLAQEALSKVRKRGEGGVDFIYFLAGIPDLTTK
jgi:hypothetical protein